MKQFKLLILLLVIGFVGEAQINYLPIKSRYKLIAGLFDSTLHIPSGTTPGLRTGGYDYRGALFYKTSDSTVYVYTGTQWISVKGSGGGGGGGISSLGTGWGLASVNDSTYRVDTALVPTFWRFAKVRDSLGAIIGTKLAISDTAGKWIGSGWLAALVKYTDTTAFLANYVRAQRLADTAAAIRAAIGSEGGTSGLQQVTDVDSTITNSIVMGQTWDAAGTDTAQASGYETILTGTGGAFLNGVTRYYLNVAQRSKVRQTGTIYKARFYLHVNPPELSAFYIYVWRKAGGVWSIVDSQNVYSQLVGAAINTVYFTPGLSAKEGDYIGYGHISSVIYSFTYATANSGTGLYYTNSHPGTTGVNWTTFSSVAYYVPIHVYMRSPQVIGIGNSIMAGHNLHWSYIEASGADSVRTTFMNKLAVNSNISIQNMGIGSQWTQHIQARFKSDVTDAKPKYAIIEGGVNDIANGGILTSTIVSNYKKMLDSCIVNSIKPIIILVIPWTAGSNSQNQRIDSLNYTLDTMVTNSYPTGYIVDVRAAIGEFRSGGDAGNLWNLKSWANADGVHVTDSANSIIASYIGRIFNESAYRSDGVSHNGNFFKYPKTQSVGTLQNDGVGNLYWGSSVFDGEYTPTITNGTNVTSSTAELTQYTRVGNRVTISGTFSMTCTTAGITSSAVISIPYASAFTSSVQASGLLIENVSGVTSPGHGTLSSSESDNDTVVIIFTPRTTGSLSYTFNITYKVL